jgi:hypothetical protein
VAAVSCDLDASESESGALELVVVELLDEAALEALGRPLEWLVGRQGERDDEALLVLLLLWLRMECELGERERDRDRIDLCVLVMVVLIGRDEATSERVRGLERWRLLAVRCSGGACSFFCLLACVCGSVLFAVGWLVGWLLFKV